MKKTDLISKWLDFNLSDTELEAFNELSASDSYHKISEAAKHFGSPDFDAATSFNSLNRKIERQRKTKPLVRYISGIAVILLLCFGLFYFLNSSTISHTSANMATVEVRLPDASEAILNAASSISYNEKGWSTDRSLELRGEAYFRVSNGSKFTVGTPMGKVTVLGTQFNVKARSGYFEVNCYEGSVEVLQDKNRYVLSAGQTFKAYNDTALSETTTAFKPDWLDNRSTFKSVPFSQVVKELERQFDIKITGKATENNSLFTGGFSHENLETALQAITIPLNLSYIIDGKNVVLKNNRQ